MSSTPPREPRPIADESAPTEVAATVTSMPRDVSGDNILASLGATDAESFDRRYQLGETIGRGGMGEVRALHDSRVGRRVAMKTLRAGVGESSDARARFVRELRTQGQLEHPAVVPVYDVGFDPSGRPYFTMKELRGETLAQILRDLGQGDAAIASRFSRRRLLEALRDVCLAVDFAHSRGVIHRDLKPGNIMLGDFGEVYVLDWGLAKATGDAEPAPREAPAGPADSDPPSTPSVDVGDIETEAGSVLGTPGYMAPEQLYGDPLDCRADVYALGAILFEVLAGEPLHRRDDNILRSTIDGLDASASARAPERDTPPELDAVCVAATATDRDERTATAREVADALDRYLDGDRDLERRAQLADEHARSGIRAMGDAFAGGDAAEQARRQAVRELGRALALDPDHDTALAAMSRLILEPPAQVPEEVEAALEAHKTKRLQLEAGGATVALLLSLAFIPVMMWIGIKNPALVATFLAIPVVLAAISFTLARWRPGPWLRYAQASLYAVFAIAASRMFSPLIVVPVLCTMVVMIVSLNGFSRLLVVTAAVMTAATVAPLLAEAAGLLTPTLWFAADALTIQSAGLHQPAVPSLIGLTTFHVLSIWGPAIVVGRIARRSWNHERQIQLHAWHLRQLVPDTTTC